MTNERTQASARPRRRTLGAEGIARRRQEIAPLFTYCMEHGISPLWAARRAAARVPGASMSKLVLSRIKLGQTPLPEWFVAGVCREIGQPIEVVMGAEWAQRHAPEPATDLPDAKAS